MKDGLYFRFSPSLALMILHLVFTAQKSIYTLFFVVNETPAFHSPETDRHFARKRANDERLNPQNP